MSKKYNWAFGIEHEFAYCFEKPIVITPNDIFTILKNRKIKNNNVNTLEQCIEYFKPLTINHSLEKTYMKKDKNILNKLKISMINYYIDTPDIIKNCIIKILEPQYIILANRPDRQYLAYEPAYLSLLLMPHNFIKLLNNQLLIRERDILTTEITPSYVTNEQ